MTDHTTHGSLMREMFHLYDKWSTQSSVYFVVLVLATGTALFLDFRLHVSPGAVLLYVLPLTVVLMIAVPAVSVCFSRWERASRGLPSQLAQLVQLLGLYETQSRPLSAKFALRTHKAEQLQSIALELERIRELTERLAPDTDDTAEVKKKWKETKRSLTALRLRQLDLRLGQSGVTPQTKLVLRDVLHGLQKLAEEEFEPDSEGPSSYRNDFHAGLDAASAAIFNQIAVIIARESFIRERGKYPSENPLETIQELIQLERDWLFKRELDLAPNPLDKRSTTPKPSSY